MNQSLLLLFLVTCLAGLLFPQSAVGDALPIENGEALTITFKGIPTKDINDHNGVYRVDDQGSVKMPYLKGRIRAKGMTVSKLERMIVDLYKSAGVYPEVTITIQKIGDQPQPKVTIAGKRAGKPGQYDFVRDMTLSDAVAIGVPNKFFQGHVHLVRGGKTYKFDIDDEKSKSIPLRPKDLIELVK